MPPGTSWSNRNPVCFALSKHVRFNMKQNQLHLRWFKTLSTMLNHQLQLLTTQKSQKELMYYCSMLLWVFLLYQWGMYCCNHWKQKINNFIDTVWRWKASLNCVTFFCYSVADWKLSTRCSVFSSNQIIIGSTQNKNQWKNWHGPSLLATLYCLNSSFRS